MDKRAQDTAAIIAELYANAYSARDHELAESILQQCAGRFADRLEEEIDTFNRTDFLNACGIAEDDHKWC